MRNLSDQAIENTLADHQLPASDRDAALSWARDDAEAELWGLIVEAINTPAASAPPTSSTAAEWMMQLASAQANDARQAGGRRVRHLGRARRHRLPRGWPTRRRRPS